MIDPMAGILPYADGLSLSCLGFFGAEVAARFRGRTQLERLARSWVDICAISSTALFVIHDMTDGLTTGDWSYAEYDAGVVVIIVALVILRRGRRGGRKLRRLVRRGGYKGRIVREKMVRSMRERAGRRRLRQPLPQGA